MIEIYSKNNCPWCDKAKVLLSERLGNYREYNIEEDASMKADLLRRFPHVRTVPQIVIDGRHIGGYNELVEYFSK